MGESREARLSRNVKKISGDFESQQVRAISEIHLDADNFTQRLQIILLLLIFD